MQGLVRHFKPLMQDRIEQFWAANPHWGKAGNPRRRWKTSRYFYNIKGEKLPYDGKYYTH